jgi:uncharacterized SAM-dependent methyltransferase
MRAKGRDNAGNLMLIHKASSTVLLGAGYTATPEMILEFLERDRTQSRRYLPTRLVADLLRSMCHQVFECCPGHWPVTPQAGRLRRYAPIRTNRGHCRPSFAAKAC